MAVNRMDKSAHFYSTGKRNDWCSQKQLWTILIFVLMLLNLAYSSSICKKNNRVPRRPPTVDMGSFTIHKNFLTILNNYQTRDIFIFWQNITKTEKCGKYVSYLVYCTPILINNKRPRHIHKKNTTNNFAKFRGLKTDIGYNFTIYSTNKKGRSVEYSIINVPSETNRITKKLSLTKTTFDERGLFQLSWTNYDEYNLTDSYLFNNYNNTLFWCETEKSHPNLCSGYLHWTHVPSSLTSYNVTITEKNLQKNYRFSLSINSFISTDNLYAIKSYASGMIWETCTVGPNKIPGKIEYIWVNFVSSVSFEIHWTLDCSDRIVKVEGYHLYYCPTISRFDSECTGPIIDQILRASQSYRNNSIILEHGRFSQITSLAVKELEPLTTYKLHLAVIVENNVQEGILSDAVFITTEDEDNIRLQLFQ